MGGGGVKNYQKLRDVICGRPHTVNAKFFSKLRISFLNRLDQVYLRL